MKIRDDTRGYYIKDNKVICIKCKNWKIGFIDIPGGKIEEGETSEQAIIREFKEETGLNIVNPIFRGIMNIRFPDRLYKMNLFLINNYSGTPIETKDHIAYLMNVSDVINSEKRFACTILLEPSFLKVFLDLSKHFELDITTTEEEIVQEINFRILN